MDMPALSGVVDTALGAVEAVVPDDTWTDEDFDAADTMLTDALIRLTAARNAIIRGYQPKAFPSRAERERLAVPHLRY